MHWGSHGAAGILVFCDDHVLLQLRGAGQYTDTWGIPGGAVERGESPLDAAVREAREEVAGLPQRLQIGPEPHVNDHGGWAYTTFVAESPEMTAVRPRDWESVSIDWIPVDEVSRLSLHPGFSGSWPQLRMRMNDLVRVRG